MSRLRIGIQIEPNDSFWIQVKESLYRNAERQSNIELVPIEASDPLTTHPIPEPSHTSHL